MQKTMNIVAEKFNVFVATVENINKRIVKHGMVAIQFDVKRKFMMDIEGYNAQVEFMEIEIIGASPRIAGWEFVAKVEHDDVIGNIVKTFMNEVPSFILNSKCSCEHCNVNRKRNVTYFLVSTETGEFIQVGSTCIQDFTGVEIPNSFGAVFNIVDELSDFEENYGANCKSIEYFDIKAIVAYAMTLTKKYGFVSKDKADLEMGNPSTADMIRSMLNDKGGYFTEEINDAKKNAGDADSIISWIVGKNTNGSAFFENAKRLVNANVCRWNDFGLVAALPAMFHKEMNENDAKLTKSNEYIGCEGEKFDVECTLVHSSNYQTMYGVGTCYRFEDAAGNLIVYFSTTDLNCDKGQVGKLVGRVKKHEVYNDRKQTIVTRCKFKF